MERVTKRYSQRKKRHATWSILKVCSSLSPAHAHTHSKIKLKALRHDIYISHLTNTDLIFADTFPWGRVWWYTEWRILGLNRLNGIHAVFSELGRHRVCLDALVSIRQPFMQLTHCFRDKGKSETEEKMSVYDNTYPVKDHVSFNNEDFFFSLSGLWDYIGRTQLLYQHFLLFFFTLAKENWYTAAAMFWVLFTALCVDHGIHTAVQIRRT